jgi:hypothetical protein
MILAGLTVLWPLATATSLTDAAKHTGELLTVVLCLRILTLETTRAYCTR